MRTTCRSPGIACWWSAGRAEPLVMCVVMQMRWRGACQPRGGPRPGSAATTPRSTSRTT